MKQAVLTSLTPVKESNGYFGATAVMDGGDTGWVSGKSKDYMDYVANNVGKEFSYEFGVTTTGGGKISKMQLVGGEAAPGAKPAFKPFKSDYNSPERLELERKKNEFEMGAKQDYIAYAVALEQANKYLATSVAAGQVTKFTISDLLTNADKIFKQTKKIVNETGTKSEE